MKKYLAVLKQFLRVQKPDNLKVVVYCVLTAATFWFFSALNKQYDATVGFPVEWNFDRERYISVSELPEKIQMNVSGLGWNLLRVNSGIRLEPLTLRLTDPVAKNRLPGTYFDNQVAEALEQLQFNYIIEDSLYFNIDYKIKESFSIYIDSANINLEEDYRIISPIVLDHDQIEIVGPMELISLIPKDTFWVKVIETNVDEDFDNEIPVQLESPELLSVTPQTIKVSFRVSKFESQETIVPVTIINDENESSVELIDSLVAIRYLVQEELQDSVETSSFQVVADLNSIDPADSTIMLLLEATSDLAVDAYISNPQVKVHYNE